MHAVSCVVFDIDDTLYLERDYVRSGFTAIDCMLRDQLGVTGFLPAALTQSPAWTDVRPIRRGRTIDAALAAVGVEPTPQLVTELVEVYRTHVPRITLLDDARSALEQAAAVPIAVVSDGPLASQRAKSEALGLAAWADPIILTASRCPDYPKPSIVPFALVQNICRTPATSCVYVADNPEKDFAGPAQLGWTTVRVRRPGALHEELPSGRDVDIEVCSLVDLWESIPLEPAGRPDTAQRSDAGPG
jgi:putative hydrolase of the HAD superfamily